MPAESRQLTRMTVNLNPRAVAALESATARRGENKTDAINHALPVLLIVLDLLERSDGQCLTTIQPDGSSERIYIL